MSVKLYISIGIAIILLIGYLRSLAVRNLIKVRISILNDYQSDFNDLSNGYFSSSYAAARRYGAGLYNWLIETSNEAQLSLACYPISEFTGSARYINVSNRLSIILTIRKFSTGNIRANDAFSVPIEKSPVYRIVYLS